MDDARRRFVAALGTPLLIGATPTPGAATPHVGAVDVTDFGARCDRIADDTAAVQRAIAACRRDGAWRDLHVPGPCRVTSSLMIDRAVDKQSSEFRVLGGGGGGFVVDRPMPLFDSRLPMTGDPQSEHIGFHGMRFEAADAKMRCRVLSGKFLRVAFDDCWFEKITAYDSPTYVQSVRVRNCRGRGWRGAFARCRGGYDIAFESNAFEAAGGLFESTHASGVRFTGNLFEGSSGPFLKVDRVNGAFVAGNYTEDNAASDYIFSNGNAGAPSHGVAMIGNFIAVAEHNRADADFWSVIVGDCRGLASSGNFCNGRLFDDTATRPGDLKSAGDGGFIALNRSGRPIA